MKANKVLERLEISRKTLSNYVSSGKIRVTELGNGFYDYNENDIESLEKETVVHKNKIIIYIGEDKFIYNLTEDKIKMFKKIVEVL